MESSQTMPYFHHFRVTPASKELKARKDHRDTRYADGVTRLSHDGHMIYRVPVVLKETKVTMVSRDPRA